MENLESISALFGFGAEKALQPPRFAKVTAVSGDAVTVKVGTASAEAVRCCVCSEGDVVLLETLPNGTLAAVGSRGQTGGTAGVESLTIGTVTGATLTNSGTASDVVLDLAVEAPEVTTDGIWTVMKWPSGIAWCWGEHTWDITSWGTWGGWYYSNATGSVPYPSGLFIAPPIEVANAFMRGGEASMYIRGGEPVSTGTKDYVLFRPSSGPTGTVGYLRIQAFGRWKQ